MFIFFCFLGFWKWVCGNYFVVGFVEMFWRLKWYWCCLLKFFNLIEGNLVLRFLKFGCLYSCEVDRYEDIIVLCVGIEEDWVCLCENVVKWNCLCFWILVFEFFVVVLLKEIGIWLVFWIDLVLWEFCSMIYFWCGIYFWIVC